MGFGLRAGAIFLVVIGSLALGRWLHQVISHYPIRVEAAAGQDGKPEGQKIEQQGNGLSRWLGRLAFLSVLVAAAVAIAAIVEYRNPKVTALDPHVLLANLAQDAQRLVAVFILLPVTLAVGRLFQRGTVAGMARAKADQSLTTLGGRAVYAATLLVGGLIILSIWGVSIILSATLLGALTLALSLALQDVLRNVFAGVYLLVERPFLIGDEITVTTFSGRVDNIQLRVTSLSAPDGQRVLVPNAMLFTSAVVNASSLQRRRVVLTVTLAVPHDASGSDELNSVEGRIRAAIEEIPGILSKPPALRPQVTLNGASQGKVVLRVTFWVPAHEPDEAQAAISRAVDRVRITLADADVAVGDPVAPPAG